MCVHLHKCVSPHWFCFSGDSWAAPTTRTVVLSTGLAGTSACPHANTEDLLALTHTSLENRLVSQGYKKMCPTER